jgi:Domain of unknown function (DUF4338)/Transposase Tn5 dimerisation domain/Transposase DNA-binding
MGPLSPKQQLEAAEHLSWIRARVGADAGLSRYRLAKEVCERLGWKDRRGRAQEMACRKHLIGLERRGAIVLPAARRRPPERRPAEVCPAPQVSGRLADLGAVTLQRVSGGTPESRTWDAMMAAHHPCGRASLCGEQIRYLICGARHGVLGGLAVSAAAWRLRGRDEWLGWDDAKRGANLTGVVCNSRFLILPTVRVAHLASHVLGQLTRRIVGDWQQAFAVRPWLMESYVEAARPGTAYRAANWIEVGMTAGRGRQDRTGTAHLPAKRVFLYPLSRPTLKRLCGARPAPEPNWVRQEFGGAKLGDRRLQRRLLDLAGAFFARPMANIAQACGSLARTKAAYRFFDHQRVTMDAVLEPHHQATVARMRQEVIVLAVQDSSSLNYTKHPQTQGLGPIGSRRDGAQGLILHNTLALRPDGLPLGLLDVQCWARDANTFGKKHQRHTRPIAAKESYKWIRPLTEIRAAADRCPNTRIVTVADRECDVFEFLQEADSAHLDLLVRATEDRALQPDPGDEQVRRLWPFMESLPAAGQIALEVPRRGRQPARTALMSVRFAEVTLSPPRHKAKLPALRLWVVRSREENPPPDIKPLDWMLLTTVPVASLDDALQRMQWYTRRWGIEVFHRILKSGCRIEDRQLETADRLETCLAIDMVVAWRIHYLTWLGRATPELPCTVAFEPEQWKALVVFHTRKPPPAQPPSLCQMILLIAQLGGFLARKSDGQPGPQTLWRGLQRLDDITAAFRSYAIAYPLPP